MASQIIFLYGRPGVGKLTVGEQLAIETGYRLLHNHAVVDLVTSLFAFGSPPFIALRERLWLQTVDAAIWAKLAGMIMTFAPEETVTDEFIPILRTRITTQGSSIHFIELR
ncbi:MAG: shikimate kinase, partial [Gemmatimonadaceae bacterium]